MLGNSRQLTATLMYAYASFVYSPYKKAMNYHHGFKRKNQLSLQ